MLIKYTNNLVKRIKMILFINLIMSSIVTSIYASCLFDFNCISQDIEDLFDNQVLIITPSHEPIDYNKCAPSNCTQ
jgi:hypothetical protein